MSSSIRSSWRLANLHIYKTISALQRQAETLSWLEDVGSLDQTQGRRCVVMLRVSLSKNTVSFCTSHFLNWCACQGLWNCQGSSHHMQVDFILYYHEKKKHNIVHVALKSKKKKSSNILQLIWLRKVQMYDFFYHVKESVYLHVTHFHGIVGVRKILEIYKCKRRKHQAVSP